MSVYTTVELTREDASDILVSRAQETPEKVLEALSRCEDQTLSRLLLGGVKKLDDEQIERLLFRIIGVDRLNNYSIVDAYPKRDPR